MMIADEVGEFLKFFDNVSYQLACLLDIDGRNGAKKSYNRQKMSLTSKARGTVGHNKANTNIKNKTNNSSNNNNNLPNYATGTSKKPPQRAKIQQSTLARRKRKGKTEKVELIIEHQQQDNNNHQNDSTTLINNDLDQPLLTQQQHHQVCDIQSHNKQPDAQVSDGPLTLGIVDDLQPLDHGSSLSPVTHLSPLDPSIQFTTSIHQQHYYPNQRGHIDSYQLHDEFTSSHESIPITNSSSHIHHQDHQQSRLNHQHLLDHQQQTRADGLDGGGSTLANSDCYPSHQNQNLHLHQHHHQHHHQQQQQQHHHVQYHQLDQQWLAGTTHTADNTLQMSTTDTGNLDHVVPLSPATHQSLEQVQFSTPLYHHGGYYNHQTEHLDSFQHINDDYANVSADPLTGNSSSTLENLHRLQESTQTAPQHLHHSGQIRSMPINGNGTGNDSYEQHHHHNQQQQQQQQHHHHHHHHHNPHHHQQHHTHSGQVHHAQPEHLVQNMDASYVGHLNNHHHQHHHSQHQVMPLINGLVEPAGVIIQDINLASASWSSPEDLYSI